MLGLASMNRAYKNLKELEKEDGQSNNKPIHITFLCVVISCKKNEKLSKAGKYLTIRIQAHNFYQMVIEMRVSVLIVFIIKKKQKNNNTFLINNY